MKAAVGVPPRRTSAVGRPGPMGLVVDQVGYATREMWRSRIVLIFTFLLPLVWLVLVGILAGNDAVDETSGVRIMQFVTPAAAVMGLLFATYSPVASSLALARDQGILRRLRGTPLPPWAYLLGRAVGAMLLGLSAVVVMLAVGTLVYHVQVIGRTLPATIATLVVGTASLSLVGLAVGALAPSASAAQSFSMATAVGLTFISGMFTIGGQPPAWLEAVAGIFPVKPLVSALKDQFNPFLSGSGWDLGALAVMAAWGAGALVVASWALRREPVRASASTTRPAGRARELGPAVAGHPGRGALVLDQARWATRSVWRDSGSVFFAIAMPIGLYALMAAMYGDSGFRPDGKPFAFFFACSMAVYGIAVTAFINAPEAMAQARDRGVLKRLRGTPLAQWQYLAGRTGSVVWIALLTVILVFAVAMAVFDVRLGIEGVPLALLVLLLGTLTLTACGAALVGLAPSGKAVASVGLGILLPLSFFSDIFLVGGSPDWMGTVGSLFPLRHFVHAFVDALEGAGISEIAPDLLVMTGWLVATTAVAVRWFRWEPRT
jgi:ABC-type multidrug transport system permease subunit